MTERVPLTTLTRFFRAFAWLRWRLLMNSLERSQKRDAMERVSRVLEHLMPVLVAILVVPGALLLGGLGVAAGVMVGAQDPHAELVTVSLRVVLMALTAAVVTMPFVFPGGRDAAGLRRLLLLPIPRSALYFSELAGVLTDPWLAAGLPMILLVPVGLAWSGRGLAAVIALGAGLALIYALATFARLTASVIQLIARDRRRSELAMLVGVLLISMLSVAPALMENLSREERRPGRPRSVHEEERAVTMWTRFLPSEMFTRSFLRAAQGDVGGTLGPFAALIVMTACAHAASWRVHSRLLDSPSGGARRNAAKTMVPLRRIPGLPAAVSAVAQAQLKLMWRSPRGRMAALGPLVMVAILSAVVYRNSGGLPIAGTSIDRGTGLAIAATFFAILSVHPIVLNQFAVAGSGLTLEFLSPVTEAQLLFGRAVAGALVAAFSACVGIGVALVLFPGSAPAVWGVILLGGISTYALFAPAAAAISMIFPRAVNMNTLGRSSNPHQLGALLGLVLTVVAAAPAAGIAYVGIATVGRPLLTAAMLAGWCAIACLLAAVLMKPVERLLRRRRENLGLVALGR